MENKGAIMELAAQLGKLIKEDGRVKELAAATAAYEQNKELQGLILEYNTQNKALVEEYKKPAEDKEFKDAIEKRMREIYEEIEAHPVMTAYQRAQEQVNAFMNEVNGEITYQITGERPCTHDCGSCGGCSH